MTPNPFPEAWLITLDEFVEALGIPDTPVTPDTDDPQAQAAAAALHTANHLRVIRQASADVIAYLRRLPLPHVRTLRYDVPRSRHLLFDADLLELTALRNGATVINPAEYELEPYNDYPKRVLTLTSSRCGGWRQCCQDAAAKLEVEGIFGYVPHWMYAWETVALVPAGSLAADATSLTFSSPPPFWNGDYGRIGTEFVQFREVETNTVTLRRGVLGTTAAAHTAGTAIEVFHQIDVIRTNAVEWAVYLEKSRGRVGERVQVSETGMLVVNDLSPLIKEALEPYRHVKGVQL